MTGSISVHHRGVDSDLEVVRRAQAGSADAFRELVRRHQAQVHAFLGRFIARLDVVEDLAQETFLKAYRHLRAYRGESSPRVWLLGIAKNEALMQLRSERSRRSREAASFDAALSGWLAERGEAGSVEDQERELRALEDCLRGLAPESAGMIDAFYYRGESAADLARRAGKREGAVRMTLLRIREALRQCVQSKVAAGRVPS